MLNRTRVLGTVAALAGGIAMLTGCSQGATNSPVPASNAAVVGQPEQGERQQADGTQPDISTEGPCAVEDVAVTLTPQPDRPGIFLMTAVNNSPEACYVDGWGGVVPLDMTGSAFEVPTEHVKIPGEPTNMRLEQGETAFAGVKMELGDKNDPNVRVANGFNAFMPNVEGTTNAKVAGADYYEYPVVSIQIGSYQPSAQGVTVF
ncbi:Protein of unknown function [Saccharopolyspora kobensis]|uniref:DUF4232 domain-containing protein n=1 Tax=Saccharopolyspora kobensis TaxID=146035 RepID=A0A1H6E0U5_9PSEU|nr:DUF4232 domain-containing protein [Saccharopolyspora kobensis]SEG90616.1 Protein of unknown function [Saccharopolyspora kobensis]SFD92601.1 Protein of unknown function [Saccharopolyspora kobensis]